MCECNFTSLLLSPPSLPHPLPPPHPLLSPLPSPPPLPHPLPPLHPLLSPLSPPSLPSLPHSPPHSPPPPSPSIFSILLCKGRTTPPHHHTTPPHRTTPPLQRRIKADRTEQALIQSLDSVVSPFTVTRSLSLSLSLFP
ncbi:hypothetical protein FHG87_010178 [Trinorchestia longiramus]|nr:hypothetical protein FHG87_010178 [Trinorchestia longiramus]